MRRKIFLLYAFHFSPFIFITFFWIFSSLLWWCWWWWYGKLRGRQWNKIWASFFFFPLSFLCHFRQKKFSPLLLSIYVWQWHFRQLNLFSFSVMIFLFSLHFEFFYSTSIWIFCEKLSLFIDTQVSRGFNENFLQFNKKKTTTRVLKTPTNAVEPALWNSEF